MIKNFNILKSFTAFIFFLLLNLGTTQAQNGPVCDTYVTASISNGLGSNSVRGVYASGGEVYAATSAGLSISIDGGTTFSNRTTADGLGNNFVSGVYASGSTVYAATIGGLSISTDGGANFSNRTTAIGLGSNNIKGVYASGSTVYAATNGGLSISTDGGATFSNRTTANGLGSNIIRGVYASGSTVYAATSGGLSISTDGGATFSNRTTADGLGGDLVFGVYVSGNTVYAATNEGLSISTDSGTTFSNRTTADGLGNNGVNGVFASGNTVYAATNLGLSISTDGGTTFSNKTKANGLGSNILSGAFASDSTVYVATLSVGDTGGLSSCTQVCTPPTSGGTVALAQSGYNPFNPAAFTSTVAASGETGTLEYKWQSSTTSNSADFIDIASSNAATYDAGVLTQTTWFKRLARVDCSADWTSAIESNVIEVTVITLAAPTAADQTFCGSKTVADLIATGTDLQWYELATGGTAFAASTALATGTYYVSQTVSGTESDRTAVVVTVRTLPTPSISGNPIICTGGTKTLDAGIGYASYLWSPNNESTQTITVGTEAAFSVTVTDNFGCTGTSDTIQTAFSTASVGLSNLGTSCLGGAQLALSGDVGTLASVQWYNSTTPIGGVTNIPLPTVVAGGNGQGDANDQLNFPVGITVDGAGNVYVADAYNYRIQKWVPNATVGITVAGGNGEGDAANKLSSAYGIAVDAAGNIYVADSENHRIQKWLPDANEGITVAGGHGPGSAANQLINPFGVAFDAAGNLYVSDTGNSRIQKWAPEAIKGITVAGGNGAGPDANQLNTPYGIAVDAIGNVYVSDYENSRVQKWAPNATEGITVAGGNGNGNANNQLAFPISLHVDASETVYIADFVSNRVMKWVKGATEGVVVAGEAQLAPGTNTANYPTGVFVSNSGEIYVTSFFGNSVQKWQPYHQSFTPITAGSYTAVVTNVHGCTTTTNAVVVNNSVAGTVSADQLIFVGTQPVAITLTGNEGTVQWQSSLNNSTFNDISGATGTTLTGIQMGALTTKRYYRAVVTSGSCASATSGVVTVSVVAPTKVQTAQCGNTLTDLKTAIVANSVPLATNYRFKVVNGATIRYAETVSRWFYLKSLTGGGAYNTTYKIYVATKHNGVWGAYGDECNVTTPGPKTKVQASQFGKTLTTLSTAIVANIISGATNYRFKVVNGTTIRYAETVSRWFYLKSLIGGGLYNTAYTISVAVRYNGVWGTYGEECTVTTPSAPLTRPADLETETDLTTFKVIGYPNPYTNTFQLDITTQSSATIAVKVYDMMGKLIEVRNSGVAELGTMEIGDRYATGVYNVIVTQGTEVKTLRMIKK